MMAVVRVSLRGQCNMTLEYCVIARPEPQSNPTFSPFSQLAFAAQFLSEKLCDAFLARPNNAIVCVHRPSGVAAKAASHSPVPHLCSNNRGGYLWNKI